MKHNSVTLWVTVLLAVLTGYDVIRALRTGRARFWRSGHVTRAHQPRKYWRSLWSSVAVLVFCAGVLVWLTFRAS